MTTGSQIGAFGAVTAGSWGVIDVPAALLTGEGAYTFKIVAQSTNSAYYSSRQGTSPPELDLTLGSAPAGAPVAGITASPTSGTAPLTVTFSDASTGGPTSWAWDFGDGTTSNVQFPPAHTYTTADTYTVSLIASNCQWPIGSGHEDDHGRSRSDCAGRRVHGVGHERHGTADGDLLRCVDRWTHRLGLGLRRWHQRERAVPAGAHLHHRRHLHREPDRLERDWPVGSRHEDDHRWLRSAAATAARRQPDQDDDVRRLVADRSRDRGRLGDRGAHPRDGQPDPGQRLGSDPEPGERLPPGGLHGRPGPVRGLRPPARGQTVQRVAECS